MSKSAQLDREIAAVLAQGAPHGAKSKPGTLQLDIDSYLAQADRNVERMMSDLIPQPEPAACKVPHRRKLAMAVEPDQQAKIKREPVGDIDLSSYSKIIVAFSGGKDSLACLLHILDAGVPRSRIELWHHDVDGQEGSTLMDWPCTRDYCRKVAEAFGVPIYFSWKVGGFEREMLRNGDRTAPIKFETPDGIGTAGGVGGKLGVRRKFPQVSADLSVRWCSAYLKIDVGSCALRNQDRFNHTRTLMVTGERAEESKARARYLTFEEDRADGRDGRAKRHVDHWRPIHAWPERDVWAIIERYRVVPHPAYVIGWGRVSCATCIFGSENQWASISKLSSKMFGKVADYESEFGVTIQRKKNVRQLAVLGQAYEWDPADAKAAMSEKISGPIIAAPGTWKLPSGAYGESCGPT
jgi:3'-phosphoadenosine 5'-phosphosulfate sulfotransferase (PAPS reductase)/FAD synthetase